MMIARRDELTIGSSLSMRIVRKVVEKFPGICFTEIRNFTGLSTGSTNHAIRRLKKLGFISEKIFWGNTRYFVPSIPESERKAICILRNESAMRILEIMFDKKRVTARHIHHILGISYPTVGTRHSHETCRRNLHHNRQKKSVYGSAKV
jgi:predicted transcriptional regulator